MLVLLATVFLVLLVYQVVNAWRRNQYWKNLGVPHPKPILFFGNFLDLVLRRKTQAEIMRDIYNEFPDEPVVGFYQFLSPRLIVRGQDLVERVLVKDFQHFVDRSNFPQSGNPLLLNLFGLTGNRWRAMRAKFSPMFTTGKLRHMFPQVNEIADDLVGVLSKKTTDVNLKEEISNFTMDVISSCAFGLETGALKCGNSKFREESKFAFQPSFKQFAKRMLLFSAPKLASALNVKFMQARTEKYFGGVIRSALDSRRRSNLTRNDFVQQMVNLLEKGYVEIENHHPSDDYLDIEGNKRYENEKIELNDDVMVGQSFVFLLAGFETTATAISFTCLELALNEDAQNKAREEIKRFPNFTYENIRDNMPFLEGCVKESLRMHPPVGNLVRLCVKAYTFPGTAVTIEPGTFVNVPSLAIHSNPDIYPEPEDFVPERWHAGGPPCSYLPFGDGPRICIGMRFATMEIKCCLAKLLLNYRIKLHGDLELPVKIDPYSFFGGPVKPIFFDLERIPAE
ncbi:unnamed protein product [Nesidiocoris tenuis]|uniref:Cytochrome P450 n=1 Tax=Nesidiocoris tenuis TaxID=355587 RepID=A0A6H5HQV2_9HEMI|nr:unnamed protein product [Nesidiocoris tenuis]